MHEVALDEPAQRVREISRRFGIPVHVIYAAVKSGELPAVHVGRGGQRKHVVIRPQAVREFIAKREGARNDQR